MKLKGLFQMWLPKMAKIYDIYQCQFRNQCILLNIWQIQAHLVSKAKRPNSYVLLLPSHYHAELNTFYYFLTEYNIGFDLVRHGNGTMYELGLSCSVLYRKKKMSTIKQNFFVLCLIKGLDLFGKYNFIITADALRKCLVKAEEQKRIVLHIIVL